jgi:hypothetical protein
MESKILVKVLNHIKRLQRVVVDRDADIVPEITARETCLCKGGKYEHIMTFDDGTSVRVTVELVK